MSKTSRSTRGDLPVSSSDKPSDPAGGGGFLSRMPVIHIAVEMVVLIAVVWYFQSQMSKLRKTVQELKESVTHHEDVLKMILTRMGAVPQNATQLPSRPPQNATQQNTPPPQPSQKPAQQKRHVHPPPQEPQNHEESEDENAQDDEEFNREVDQEVQELEKEDHDVESVDITEASRPGVGGLRGGIGVMIVPKEQQEEQVQFVKPKDLKSRRRTAK